MRVNSLHFIRVSVCVVSCVWCLCSRVSGVCCGAVCVWCWWCGRCADDMSLSIHHRGHASNWGGRTPGSLTPGVPATPSPRQRRTLRHRGLIPDVPGQAGRPQSQCRYKPERSLCSTGPKQEHCQLTHKRDHDASHRGNEPTGKQTGDAKPSPDPAKQTPRTRKRRADSSHNTNVTCRVSSIRHWKNKKAPTHM